MLEQEQPDFLELKLAHDDEPEVDHARKTETSFPKSKSADIKSVPLDALKEHTLDLRTGKAEERDLGFEEAYAQPEVSTIAEAPPAAISFEALLAEQQGETGSQTMIERSAWHSIEVDKKSGKAIETPSLDYGEEFYHEQQPEKKAELEYEDMMDPSTEKEEVAVASGQLAVSTLADDEGPTMQSTRSSNYDASSVLSLAERIAEAIENFRSGSSSFSSFDVILWAILLLIILAIIFAIRA